MRTIISIASIAAASFVIVGCTDNDSLASSATPTGTRCTTTVTKTGVVEVCN